AVGDVLQFLKRSTEALKHYEQALELFRAVGARLGEANTLQAVGDVLQFLKRSTEALKHYEQALELFRAVGDRLGEANTLLMMGRLARKAGKRNQAIAYLQQAIGAYQAIEAIQGEGNGHFLLGETYFYLGEYATAIEEFQTALPIFEHTGDRYSQAMTWRNLGDAQMRQGQSWEARIAYETARDLYRQAGLDEQAAACEQAIKNLSRQVVVAPPKAPTIGEAPATEPDWLKKSMPTVPQPATQTSKAQQSLNQFIFWLLVGLAIALLLWWIW
ncbi:MAG: tetratricopeptide repeat protein, partial [Cyanobacteria bacterium J06638_28]